MKYILALMILVLFFSTNIFAVERAMQLYSPQYQLKCEPIDYSYNSDYQNVSILLNQDMKQRGCCSWHQGVCGCSNGRQVCCDGSLSPSCRC